MLRDFLHEFGQDFGVLQAEVAQFPVAAADVVGRLLGKRCNNVLPELLYLAVGKRVGSADVISEPCWQHALNVSAFARIVLENTRERVKLVEKRPLSGPEARANAGRGLRAESPN